MRKNVYSICDSQAKVFGPPILRIREGEVLRDFKVIVNSKESGHVHEFPEHFDLYHLGEFDDESGKFLTLDTPRHIMKAIQVKETGPAVQVVQ